MKYLAYIYYYLFNYHKTTFQSNIEGLEEIRLIPLQIGSIPEKEPTKIDYLTFKSVIPANDTRTVIIDYSETSTLLNIMKICNSYYNILNFIILSDENKNCKNLYLDKYFFKNDAPRANIFLLENPYVGLFKQHYDTNQDYMCVISVYTKIENILLFIFYSILSISMLLLYFIFRIWIAISADRDPVCTITEMAMCPKIYFCDIKDKTMDSCLICMDSFQNNDTVRFLTCNHYYHADCVDEWLESISARCPYCRKLMKMDI